MKDCFRSLALSLAAAALFAGCGKKAEPEAPAAEAAAPAPAAATPAAPGKEVLPGSNTVRDALAKKEYERAVGSLLALKGAAVTSAQTEEYMRLYDEVKFGLMDAETDPKAAQALAMLRAASSGR